MGWAARPSTTTRPAVRAVEREAKAGGYRFSDLVLGIVKSTPFQMRRPDAIGVAASGSAVPVVAGRSGGGGRFTG